MSLTNDWGEVDANSRFFRVRVSMAGSSAICEIVFDTLG